MKTKCEGQEKKERGKINFTLHSQHFTLKKERVRRRRTCSLHHVKSYKELTEDALALSAEEGRGTLRKAWGSCERAPIPGCPNGETRQSAPLSLVHEPNSVQGGTRGTETSKYPEEKRIFPK